MKRVHISLLAALFVMTASVLHARPGEVTLTQMIETVGLSTNKQITDILQQQVPRLSYTGLAFAAGTVGICTSYNGFKRLCKGIDEEKRKTTITGAAELTFGLSATAASIAIIHFLWSR
jgi:hypothetical protein